jgi:hypothetical protein
MFLINPVEKTQDSYDKLFHWPKFSRGLCLALLSTCLVACSKVTVNAENKSRSPVDLRLDVYDGSVRDKTIPLGRVESGGTRAAIGSQQVRRGRSVQVIGSLPEGPQVYSGGLQNVGSSDLSIDTVVTDGDRILDNDNAQKILSNALGNLGEDVGFRPLSVSGAIASIWGGLVCYAPNQFSRGFAINPQTFSSVHSGALEYQAANSSDFVEIDKNTVSSFSVKYPILAEVIASVSSSDVSKISYSLTGVGWVPKAPPPGWNLLKALQTLDDLTKRALNSFLGSNTNARCMYVEQIYAVQQANFKSYRGVRAAAGMDINAAGGVVAGGVAYTFSSAAASDRAYATQVLNVGGPVFRLVSDKDGELIPISVSDPLRESLSNVSVSSLGALEALERGEAVRALNAVPRGP